MPIIIDLDPAIFRWQAKYGERLTYAELARRSGISLPTLHRMKSGELIYPDLRKINEICKVLECEPGDLLKREDTRPFDDTDEHQRMTYEEVKAFEEELKRINEERDEAGET